MKALFVFLATVIGLALLLWLGLRIRPKPFPAFPQAGGPLQRQPLPDGLPAPVERFYRQLYGDSVPVIDSLVVTGRASLRILGIPFPARFRFTHLAGQGYRHYIENTLFGLPVFRVDEHYLEGRGRLDLPFGLEEGPKIDQGANLGLWAETLWLPSIYLTDPRVRWAPIDDETALLIVPFGEEEQRFVARFDPQTSLVRLLESMRYKGSNSERKTLWISEALVWREVDGHTTFSVGAATWLDEGRPWAVFTVEEIRVNVDVETYIRARGP